MEFDMDELIKQISDMAIDSMLNSLPKDDKTPIIKKTLDIFSKYGVCKMNALLIAKELAELFESEGSNDKQTTHMYVCKYCCKKFDKSFENIESVLAYHMQTEHPDEALFKPTCDLIEDSFTEE